MSVFGCLRPKGQSGFGFNSTAEEVTSKLSLSGKTVLITGCNSGLGFETMRVLAERGARVIGTARTDAKAKSAVNKLSGNVRGLACELADPNSVQACIDTLKSQDIRFDAIICNAGIMRLPKLAQAYGFELQFFTNHIGHFKLVTGLLDVLADDGRIVLVSSASHRKAPPETIQFDNLSGTRSYEPATSYGQSKIANILFAKELSRRFSGTAKTANAVHPGTIQTGLTRYINAPAWVLSLVYAIGGLISYKNVGQGAATQCYVSVHPALASTSGEYFADCNIAQPRADANDPYIAAKLWDVSESILKKLN